MNLDQITTKCWILALFERDDGERLLLGDGWFDFKDSLQHFQPNNIASDIVELQGTDGQLLAGQVRRTASQSFDGYVGDALTSKTEIENRRRQFIQFFRVRRFYKVIYIFPDGSAIQRKRGYLTDAPSVPEMWQKFPEYHVALNFEDVNYYEYSEDEQGKEIYANTALIELLNLGIGGLVWDSVGAVSHGYTWLEPVTLTGDYITISDGLDSAPLTLQTIYGNATQTTYSGKNKLNIQTIVKGRLDNGNLGYASDTSALTLNADSFSFTTTANYRGAVSDYIEIPSATFDFMFYGEKTLQDGTVDYQAAFYDSSKTFISSSSGYKISGQLRYAVPSNTKYVRIWFDLRTAGTITITEPRIEFGASTLVTSYEPFVGGTASPNPDYPQAINTVTGEQTVKVTGKNLFDINTLNKGAITVMDGVASGTALQFHQAFGSDGIQPPIPNQQFTITATAYTDGNVSTAETIGLTVRALYTDGTLGNLLSWNNSDTTASTKTGTTSNTKTLQAIRISYNNQGGNIWHLSNIQLELGSQVTSYEPFTSQSQEIDLYEPNLFDISKVLTNGTNVINNGDGTLTVQAYGTQATNPATLGTYCQTLQAGDEVVLKADTTSTNKFIYLAGTNTQWRFGDKRTILASDLTSRVLWYSNSGSVPATISNISIAKPIELAKIGTYQDRIYKDDGKWYIEKQIGKVVLDGSESWTRTALTTGARYFAINNNLGLPNSNSDGSDIISDHFIGVNYGTYYSAGGVNGVSYSFYNSNHYIQCFSIDGTWASGNDFKTWLQSNPTTVYYALAAPTTTEITDETLLEQLEYIYSLYEGVNHISITPTAGAQGTMEVKYYTVLDTTGAGYEWEPGGGSSTTTVEVAGIDNAEPIWTVTGPATNPTLTNITTGQAITWNGTVPAGQTLIADMGNQSATLAGANVYQFISGSWIALRPGANKLSYSATGGAEEPSQLEWNGVVG